MNTQRTTPMNQTVGVVGLGVMGKNLALNMVDQGFSVCGLDRTAENVNAYIDAATGSDSATTAYVDVDAFMAQLPAPRVIILMVPAGGAVDAVCEELLAAGAGPDDLVVDCGNSDWQDTEQRAQTYAGRLTFFATGVSGGEQGARFGPSLMASGDRAAWARLEPIWQAIAARAVHNRDGSDPACAAYVGPGGSGHFVKMVHNGIEYADMQLICEAYHVLRSVLGYAPKRIGELFAHWSEGPLASYLLEITSDILQTRDPGSDRPLVDCILDRAGQKGTGVWTVINALQLGSPAGLISEAVFARALSARKDERLAAAELYATNRTVAIAQTETAGIEKAVHNALYAAKICAYAQGFGMMQQASQVHGWNLPMADVARIWRGGCVIRADLLDTLRDVLVQQPDIPNLLLSSVIKSTLSPLQADWRRTLGMAIQAEVPVPALSAALAYFDGYKTAVLPAQLLQAQRDYFGAHTYERIDQEPGQHFHLHWHESPRRETPVKRSH